MKLCLIICSLVICLFCGFTAYPENKSNEYYSFDEKYVASIKEKSPNEFTLIISSDRGVPVTTFTRQDFNISPNNGDSFRIDSVTWAKRGHELMAVQISGTQWTDIKLAYYDKDMNQWVLVNLGPPIGYYEPTWVKEDKVLVTYAGSEDEYGVCIFDFERHSITYFVPYKGSIKYDCQGVVFQNDVGTIRHLKYNKLLFQLEEPIISEKNVWLADKIALKKSDRFIEKLAHFKGNDKRYLCGKDFYYFDFLGYSNIPVRSEYCKYVSYPLPTRNKGFAGLNNWTGYRYTYSFNGGLQYKSCDIATSELEENSKNQESEMVVKVEVRPNERKKFDVKNLTIEIKDTSGDIQQTDSQLDIMIQQNQKKGAVSIAYIRSENDPKWWTPVVCIEKEPSGNIQLLAVKYINNSGLCTDIYAINLR